MRPRAGLQVAAAGEHGAHGLQHLAAGGLQRERRPARAARARASGSPSSARSASSASAATGAGRSGQARAARSPASAAAADSPAPAEPVDDRARRRPGPAPNSSLDPLGDVLAGRRVPAEDDDQLVGVHADQHLAAHRPGGPADGGVRVLDAVGVRADQHDDRAHRRPAEGGGPAGQLLGALAADQGVDDERLQAGVPGAAVLGEAGVDVRGGEGDLAAELEDGDVQRLLVAGLGDRARRGPRARRR